MDEKDQGFLHQARYLQECTGCSVAAAVEWLSVYGDAYRVIEKVFKEPHLGGPCFTYVLAETDILTGETIYQLFLNEADARAVFDVLPVQLTVTVTLLKVSGLLFKGIEGLMRAIRGDNVRSLTYLAKK